LFALGISSLEVIKDVEVFSWCEVVEKYVMLGAHAHKLSHFVHLLEHVNIEAASISL